MPRTLRSPARRVARTLACEELEDRTAPAAFVVTTTNPTGSGSLRTAILAANSTPGFDTIVFNVGGGGVQTIRPTSQLPTVVDPVAIDGTTQPGYAGSPLIEIDGSLAGVGDINGLIVTAGNSTLRALAITNFSNRGVFFRTGGGNRVEGCHIGTDVAGTQPRGNGSGVIIGPSIGNVIGGTAPGAGN